MKNDLRELIYGLKPMRREHPKQGESEWYYSDPRGASTVSDMKSIDVPSENSPNPFAGEIQDYLYDHDRDNYDALYGDALPPKALGANNNVQNCYMTFDSKNLGLYNNTGQVGNSDAQSERESGSAWNTIKRAAENFADATEAGAVGYTSGLTLGNFDEGMGAATAIVTLNPDNYKLGRDATRQLQNDLQQRHPYIYGGAEFVGAMRSPTDYLTKLVTPSKIVGAAVNTIFASAGYAENWKDFGENLIANGIANTAGLKLEKLPWNKGAGKWIKRPVKQGLNYLADKTKNWYYDGNDE